MSHPESVTVAEFAASTQAARSGFYMCMAYLLVACVVAGFWPTYFGAVLGTGMTPPHPGWIIHAHATIFLGWMLVFAFQTTQVWRRRVDLHRRFGIYMAVYGLMVAAFGLYASFQLEVHRFSFTGDLDLSARRLLLSLGTIGLFSGFLGAAIHCRRKPELHKRLMVVATCSLASPGVARLYSRVLELPNDPILVQLFLLSPLLLFAAYDVKVRGRPHSVIILGILLNALLFNHGPFARSEFWLSIGRTVLGPLV